jgi:hypothetical protein
VDNLKGKILLASMIAALAILAFSPAANAAVSINVNGFTDKTSYVPGDKVTVTVFIYESGTDTINLKNVTVIYPWYSILWGGNQTINANNAPIAQGESWNFTATFTIPTDGRASSGYIDIHYYAVSGSNVYENTVSANMLYLHVSAVPQSVSLQNMDNLVTLMTVETVLIIISAIIIAAAIFLTAHRPKVSWTAEQKE